MRFAIINNNWHKLIKTTMMKILTRVNYFCAFSSNLAFKSFADAATREQIISAVSTNPASQSKLDALTDVIFSLSNI